MGKHHIAPNIDISKVDRTWSQKTLKTAKTGLLVHVSVYTLDTKPKKRYMYFFL